MEPFVRRMEKGEELVERPAWAEVRRAIEELQTRPEADILLEGGEQALMIVCFSPPYGFYLVARQDDETGESVLLDEGAGDELVEALIGGNPDDVPRRTLVPESLALAAAEEFYSSGKRLESLSWDSS